MSWRKRLRTNRQSSFSGGVFYIPVTRADYLSGRSVLHFASIIGNVRCIRLLVADFLPSVPFDAYALDLKIRYDQRHATFPHHYIGLLKVLGGPVALVPPWVWVAWWLQVSGAFGGGVESGMRRRRKATETSRGGGGSGGSRSYGDGSGGGGLVIIGDGGGCDEGTGSSVSGGGCGGSVSLSFGGLQASGVPPLGMSLALAVVAGPSATGIVPGLALKLSAYDVAVASTGGEGGATTLDDDGVSLGRKLAVCCMNLEMDWRFREGLGLKMEPGMDKHG
ncbi:hypothetical protein Dimus_015771 [Dionaea muscipula]